MFQGTARAILTAAVLCLTTGPDAIASGLDLRWATLRTNMTAPRVLPDGRVVDPRGPVFRPVLDGDRLSLEADDELQQDPFPRPGRLPDGGVAMGRRNIHAAWLTGPTDRYRHGALGDTIEAGGLAVELKNSVVLRYDLPPDSVFEDLTPRLADVDGDGSQEVVVVRSYLAAGAAVMVLKAGPDGLVPLAESAPIGTANRWLNPAGVADFDGDGRPEIAVVETPHIGGVLRLHRLAGNALPVVARKPGFSNHVLGSRDLGLSAVTDADGDGRPDLVVPDAARKALRVVAARDGALVQIALAPLPRPIASNMAAVDLDGKGGLDVLFALEGGTLAALLF
ncbi:MAG: VCBS repeat-containing protein [Hyphomicrobiales bacterium]|nr:VCBS repeat-containing protein [Hyphomicrobiales bacterium]